MALAKPDGEERWSWWGAGRVPLLALMGIGSVLALAVGYDLWLNAVPRQVALRASCLSNMKSLALATLTYARDNDDRLPPRPRVALRRGLEAGQVSSGPLDLAQYFPADDWHRQIHYRNPQVFMCPSTHSMYSYEFNTQAYGLSTRGIETPGSLILESETGYLSGVPAGPHDRGYNVTYCDGHAKWERAGSGPVGPPTGETEGSTAGRKDRP